MNSSRDGRDVAMTLGHEQLTGHEDLKGRERHEELKGREGHEDLKGREGRGHDIRT